MARRLVRLTQSNRTKAWQAFIDILKSDSLLSEYFKTWRVWDGTPNEATPWAEQEVPWIRITPVFAPAKFFTTCSLRTDILAQIEMVVPGTDVTQILDAYEAIERALFPTDSVALAAVKAKFDAVGVMTVEPVQPPRPEPASNGKYMTAKADFRVWLTVPL